MSPRVINRHPGGYLHRYAGVRRQFCDELHAKKALAEVLDHVASDDKTLADFIRSETAKRADEIAKEARVS